MRIKLKDAFELQIGKTPSRNKSEYWNGVYKWVSISDIGNSRKYVYSTRESITDKGIIDSGIKVIPKGTVIMSFKLSIGNTAITTEDMYTNEAIVAFIDKKKIPIDIDYMYYLCSGSNWMQGVNKAVMGLTLNKATLSEKEINIPNIEIQKKCACNLDKIDRIIDLKKQQLDQLDLLARSLFIEMFGDISDQDKVEVSRICKLITDGTHQPPKFEERGIPFLFVSNIVTNNITYDTEKFISEETYKELIKRTPIEIGDLLLSTVGSYGHAAIVKFTKRFCFQRHIAYLKPKSKIVDSEYFRSAILSDNVQRQIHLGVKGIAQKTLNLSEIRKLRIPLPPMVQQQQFAKVVIEIDKSKLAVKKSLEELEVLKKSLMQKYFA